VQLGYGVNQMRFQATITQKTSSIAVDIACNKEETKRMLDNASIPVASGSICVDEEDLEACVKKIGYPIVIKPLDGNHGKGASINVTTWEDAQAGLEYAKKYSRRVIVEKFITGFDFRVLIIDNKLVAAAKRVPAHVIGNGTDTIQKLIETTNLDPRRGYGHENVLTQIDVDRDTLDLLEKLNYTVDTVPKNGETVYLKSTANLSTGGTSVDVTDMMHPENIFVRTHFPRHRAGHLRRGHHGRKPHATAQRKWRLYPRGQRGSGIQDAPCTIRGFTKKRSLACNRYVVSAGKTQPHPDYRRHRNQRENHHHPIACAHCQKQRV
jgi:cyanophycin synthetase